MKSRSMSILLCLLLGGLGVHKFYLNKPGVGIIYLLFCWTFIPCILSLFELFILISMNDIEFNEIYNGGRQ